MVFESPTALQERRGFNLRQGRKPEPLGASALILWRMVPLFGGNVGRRDKLYGIAYAVIVGYLGLHIAWFAVRGFRVQNHPVQVRQIAEGAR